MSLADLWVRPTISELSLWQWGATVGVLVLAATLFSPHRRRAMGAARFVAAQAASIAAPLAGVLVVRTGFRHALLNEGRSYWDAIWISGLWMAAFILLAQAIVVRAPPTAGLLRDLRRAGRDMWIGRFRRFFARPSALERPI